ncbi:ABC transporter ATP-binding protein [Microbacterium horticulturae]|uniref:ABC transporter ATP-binding protein n=1 Tax=Microbacterium horticulturae TaxID=3028316 RepID=A0ABY8BX66_9MICO|nr:ABC transporter ATP-binding protein [Microbacterium sp. KACC 23027]WEG08786.1 ABC transporter ATP-binding protein [Microbacterium sp. KACC 23027]
MTALSTVSTNLHQNLDPQMNLQSSSDQPVVLGVDNIVADYNGKTAVDGVGFTIHAGEFVTLLGPSGCGKTTTLRCVAGLHRISKGAIHIDGRLVADQRTHVRPEKRGLNMVFQSYALWPHMTVFQNVAYGLRAQRVPKSEIRGRVEEMLDLVGLGGYGPRGVSELSGGQQQRVVLARGLATRPRLLLLDEPLSNLDSELRARMRAEIHSLQRELGLTALYVTHDRTEALALSDRVIVMRAGTIQQEGSPGELYDAPANRFVAEALGPVNVVPAVVISAGATPAARLQLEGAPVVAIASGADDVPAVGTGIEVLIRPESITLASAGESHEARFDVDVAVVEFLGNRTELAGESAGVRVKADLDLRATNLRPGDRTALRLRLDQLLAPLAWQPVTSKK